MNIHFILEIFPQKSISIKLQTTSNKINLGLLKKI